MSVPGEEREISFPLSHVFPQKKIHEYEVKKKVQKFVEMPVVHKIQKFVDVPVTRQVEQIVQVPKIETVDKIVKVPVQRKVQKTVQVEQIVEVPRIEYVDEIVEVKPKDISLGTHEGTEVPIHARVSKFNQSQIADSRFELAPFRLYQRRSQD